MNSGDMKTEQIIHLRRGNESLRNKVAELGRELITSYGESEELSLKVAEQASEIESLRISYDAACMLVAQLHEAVMGEVVGPRHGVVEDVRNKVAKQAKEIEALQAEIAYRDKTILALEVTNIGAVSLRLQVVEQAAVIEKLREVINSLLGPMSGFDPDNKPSTFACHHHSETCSNCAVLVGNWKVKCAAVQLLLLTKTDSKQILADWMREQLGEPRTYLYKHYYYDGSFVESEPLFKLPECLK